MKKVSLALDWTPNTNHIGFFVAKDKGIFKEHGLEITMLDPAEDNYQITPAKKVETGLADFALCPMESVISYRTKALPFKLKAVAAIFKEDLSAIVGKKSITSPKDLDNKTYASYHARYEDEIVKQMIRSDGGEGSLEIVYPDKLGIWDTILNEKYDATWIFMNWEGVQAKKEQADLSYFKLKDYAIPYSYSPVIATNEESINIKEDAYKQFLAATKEGFLYAKGNDKEATEILAKYVPERDKNIDLIESLHASSKYFGDKETWGKMDPEEVELYVKWIKAKGLESADFRTQDLITNSLL